MYLYKVTLVALVTRGHETVHFAFDLVLLIILFWGAVSAKVTILGKNDGNQVVAVYLVRFIPFG